MVRLACVIPPDTFRLVPEAAVPSANLSNLAAFRKTLANFFLREDLRGKSDLFEDSRGIGGMQVSGGSDLRTFNRFVWLTVAVGGKGQEHPLRDHSGFEELVERGTDRSVHGR
jgi:hypothetical protein